MRMGLHGGLSDLITVSVPPWEVSTMSVCSMRSSQVQHCALGSLVPKTEPKEPVLLIKQNKASSVLL